MKYVIKILLVINIFSVTGQEVKIKGKILNDLTEKTPLIVTTNDTLPVNYTIVRKKGKFKIKAKTTDTLFFRSYRHHTQKYLVADLIMQKNIEIVLLKEKCEEYVECKEEKPKLFIFIGEKIKVDRAKHNYYCNKEFIPFDSKFKATYKVIKNIHGELPRDTLQFTVYDHYGRPNFEKYKHSVMYVVKYCDKLVHLKYQFNNVYMTKSGKWAAPYQTNDYKRMGSDSNIKPEKIEFVEPIIMNFKEADFIGLTKEYFPAPYYEVNGRQVKAIYGNYLPELLELKKETVLKEQGF